jgi:hypothetical protein
LRLAGFASVIVPIGASKVVVMSGIVISMRTCASGIPAAGTQAPTAANAATTSGGA